MENNENFVPETENVEHTTEQTPKMFTQEEVNEIVGKAKARTRAKIEKETQSKYGELHEVLKAGMGKEDIGEITSDLRIFYGERKGIKMPQKPDYTEQDIETLADADARAIIREGFEEAEEEFTRLEQKGAKMTKRELATFKILAEHLQEAQMGRALSKIGVTEEEYNSKEYQEFRKQFNSDVPEEKRYNLYRQTQPKKDIKPMGSMKNNNSGDNGVKDFYTPEEARRFTKKDFDNNPALFKAVEQSMLRWKR
jgi:hypothetical protein